MTAMATERVLFGTDGIRGIANRYPMTPEVALQLGKAVARSFRNGKSPVVVIGKDTRLSGYLFENALTAGLCAAGATVYLVGPMPTPAVAHITRSFAADAGIMITASHNPAEHNGIKLFDAEGFKLPDEQEQKIERLMLESLKKLGNDEPEGHIGKAHRIDDARGRYIEFAKATIRNRSLSGLKVVLDCANGAAYSVTPLILRELGADVIALNDEPDGLNINLGCGALHPEAVREALLANKADIGIALDGDADRAMLVDERGELLDGDRVLGIVAPDLRKRGRLASDTIVGTVYSNSGLDESLARSGIKVVRVENGDRYVTEEMRRKGYSLGGEQSGHIIFLEYTTTGDGTIAALQVLRIMKESGKRLSELASGMTRWPQRTVSVAVREKVPFEQLPKVRAAIAQAGVALGASGRVLVRYSGTERKVRVMVEAKESTALDAPMDSILRAFKEEGV
jgi:phosphoglucosamine mutase